MSKFDVFISFKHTDSDGEKTQDYYKAKELYDALTAIGIRVFFSPESLRKNAVYDYGKFIDEAIEGSDIIIAVSSSEINFSSKWVEYELNAFRNEMLSGRKNIPPAAMISFVSENLSIGKLPVFLRPCESFSFSQLGEIVEWVKNRIGASDPSDRQPLEEKKETVANRQAKSDDPPETDTAAGEAQRSSGGVEANVETKPAPPSVDEEVMDSFEKERLRRRKARRRRLFLLYFLASLVVYAAAFLITTAVIKAKNTVVIAGEKHDKRSIILSIEDKALSAEDIDNIASMTRLGILSLVNCSFPDSDIGSMLSRPTVKLTVNNCGLTDDQLTSADFLSSGLSLLYIDGNKSVTSLDCLKVLGEQLRYLSFNNCSVSDVSFIENLTGLERLYMAGNGITSLQSLSKCTKLEEIDASDNLLEDLGGLESSIYLKNISFKNNKLANIDGLKNTTLLEYVDLSANKITDISVLAKSKESLKELNLSSNTIATIAALTGATILRELDISYNEIEDISPLARSFWLTSLSAGCNKIKDISVLSEIGGFNYLSLFLNKIEKTDSIRMYDGEEGATLDISYNNIETLVIPQVNYRDLKISGNPLTDFSNVYKVKAGSITLDYSEIIDLNELKNTECLEYLIIGCPLDKRVAVEKALGKNYVKFYENSTEE